MMPRTPAWQVRYEQYMLAHMGLTNQTINNHMAHLRGFAAWVMEHPEHLKMDGNRERSRRYGILAAATGNTLKTYLSEIEHVHTAGHRRHIKTSLARYFHWMTENGIIPAAIDTKITVRSGQKDRGNKHQWLSSDSAIILRGWFTQQYGVNSRNRLMLETLLSLGVRVHELLPLRLSDFDLDKQIVNIESTKTDGISQYGGHRRMVILDGLAHLLSQYEPQDAPLFDISRQRVFAIIRKAGAANNMGWLNIHRLRHYSITQFAGATAPDGVTRLYSDKELALMFGVSPQTINETYNHPTIGSISAKQALVQI